MSSAADTSDTWPVRPHGRRTIASNRCTMLIPGRFAINSKVFVGNMNYDTTSNDLETLFSEVGEVVDIFVPTDRNTGRPRGFAFVQFTEQSAAAEAIEKFDGYELQGRNIRVSEAEERQRRAPSYSDGGLPPSPKGPKGGKPKGSRRNIRGRKRGF